MCTHDVCMWQLMININISIGRFSSCNKTSKLHMADKKFGSHVLKWNKCYMYQGKPFYKSRWILRDRSTFTSLYRLEYNFVCVCVRCFPSILLQSTASRKPIQNIAILVSSAFLCSSIFCLPAYVLFVSLTLHFIGMELAIFSTLGLRLFFA